MSEPTETTATDEVAQDEAAQDPFDAPAYVQADEENNPFDYGHAPADAEGQPEPAIPQSEYGDNTAGRDVPPA